MTSSTIVRPGAFHSPARKARLLLASLPIFAGLLAEDGTVLECNFGPLGGQLKERSDWVGHPFITGAWWNYSDASRAEIQTMLGHAQTGHPASKERLYKKFDGTMGVMVLSLTPLFAPYGTPDAILVTAVDITERRREIDQAAHIAHDMAHRLRNSFTMMRIIGTRSEDMNNGSEAAFPRRLSRLCDSHTLSYRYLFFEVPTQDIVETVLSEPAQLTQADYDQISIPADYVETLMLAIGELAQSGHKAKFIAQRVGTDQVSLIWSEDIARSEHTMPTGLALALLTTVPEQKTTGYVQMENEASGFFWRFVFPLHHPDLPPSSRR